MFQRRHLPKMKRLIFSPKAVLPKPKEKLEIKPKEKQNFKESISVKKKSNFAVMDAVQSLAWTLAVGWARQKLKNYIADDQKPDENSES